MLDKFFMAIASVGKYFIPPVLRPRLRDEYSYFVRRVFDWRSKKNRDQYLKNGTYLKWYAEQSDNDVKDNLVNKRKLPARLDWMKEGIVDLNTAKKLGLQPNNTLLDYGCGFLRSGNHFIAYLNDGNYFANDASGERIAYGKTVTAEILSQKTFQQKNPRFYVNEDNTFDWLDGKKFDFIWSCSVLAHMPQADIECLFDNIKKVMHEKSIFLFTYSCADMNKFREWENASVEERKSGIHDIVTKKNHMFIIRALKAKQGKDCIEVDALNWFHTLDFYKKIVEPRGYAIEDVSYALPNEDGRYDYAARLAKVTLLH